MKTLIAVLLAMALPLHAAPAASLSVEDRLAALEARNAKLEAELLAIKNPRMQISAGLVNGMLRRGLLVAGPLAALPPILPATLSGGGGGGGVGLGDTPTWTGAHTFSADVTLNGGTNALMFGDSNVAIYETATDDLAMAADGAVQATLSSGTLTFPTNHTITTPGNIIINAATGVYLRYNGANVFGAIESDAAWLLSGKHLITPVTATTIADNGTGTAAAYTTLPAGRSIEVTCNDANTCEWTITETSARDGLCARIVNAGTNSLVMKHAAGQALYPSAVDQTLGQNDEVEVCYSTARSAWLGTAAINR